MQQLLYPVIDILPGTIVRKQILTLLPLILLLTLPKAQVQGRYDEQVKHCRGDQATQDDNGHRMLDLVTRDRELDD